MADTKPQAPRAESGAPEAQSITASEQSLGKLMAAARERRGLSQNDAAKEAHIPGYYVRMIENDDYALISDQLYLLPFLRRYASFLGLEAEEVASRFIRDVQRSDVTAARTTEPMPMIDKKPRPWRRIAGIVVAVILIFVIADLTYRYLFLARKPGPPGPAPAHSVGSAPPAPAEAPAAAAGPPGAAAAAPAAAASAGVSGGAAAKPAAP